MTKNSTVASLKWPRRLMILSMLLLLSFVYYWLHSQYLDGKETLRKELQASLDKVQTEITDSLLFGRYIGPAMEQGKQYSTTINTPSLQNHTISVYNSGNLRHVMDSLKQAMGGQFLQQPAENTMVLIEPRGTTIPKDINDITHLVSSAVRQILKDSSRKISFEILPGDIGIIQQKFNMELAREAKSLKAQWSGSTTLAGESNSRLQVICHLPDKNAVIAISDYQLYLLQKLAPQLLFAVLLILLFLAAFFLVYRNLGKQLQLGEIKNGFISNMSHELKTPVSIVKVALEAMDDYDIINNPTQAREYIQMAKLETNRLEMLIDKTLNTSLLEQGRISLKREPINIVILIREIIESLKLRLQQDDACINLHTEGADFILNIDKLHVQGVMLNILDNSIKYGGPSVKIDINVIGGDATLTIHITDNGTGIPEKYRELVFEKFFRIPTGDQHNIQGYGLGLSYVKQVMQLHAGTVMANNMPGGGCRFTLQFFRGA